MFLPGLVVAFRLPLSVARNTFFTYLQNVEHAPFLKSNDHAVVIYDDELEPLSFIKDPHDLVRSGLDSG
jgi:hypothetical protein